MITRFWRLRRRDRIDRRSDQQSVTYALRIGLFVNQPLQRIWSDSNIAERRALLLLDMDHEIYGKMLLSPEDRTFELTGVY